MISTSKLIFLVVYEVIVKTFHSSVSFSQGAFINWFFKTRFHSGQSILLNQATTKAGRSPRNHHLQPYSPNTEKNIYEKHGVL